jgi:D-sedoheptulose 7-phosphate isomerase
LKEDQRDNMAKSYSGNYATHLGALIGGSMVMFSSETYLGLIKIASDHFIVSTEYDKAIQILLDCYKRKGVVYTMGCGGSASTATHFAADLAKTVGGFKAISLVDNIPLVSAYTNDEGWNSIFRGQLESWLTKDDVLVGFSVHGGSGEGNAGPWSKNLVAAMKLAQDRGAKIIGFSGFDGGAMKEMADACLIVPTDSEVYGTPLVEAMHVVIDHGIIFDLKGRIK